MARSDYVESPRSSRRSRKNSHPIPPPAPEVDWSQPVDQDPHSHSQPRQARRPTVRHTVVRDRDDVWDHRDEEIPPRTPESRTSSSSCHPTYPPGHRSDHRRDRSTPSRSVASSRTSVHTVQPPRSSMNRQSDYRRPTVALRDATSAAFADDRSRDRQRSQSRPRSHALAASLSRRTSRTFDRQSAFGSDTENDDTASSFDSHDEEDRPPRSRAENRLVPVRRVERSRSRHDAARRSDRQDSRRREPSRPIQEDFYDTDSGQALSLHEEPLPRTPTRSRSQPRAQSRSRSRAVSVSRTLPHEREDHVYDHDDDASSDDASAEESSTHNLRQRFEQPTRSHKNHPSRTREHRRTRSEMHVRRSSPSNRSSRKEYDATEIVEVEKHVRQRPPSASTRRPNTVHGSVAASQHQSVSSSTKRPSSAFLDRFFRPPLPKPRHHHTPEQPKKLVECLICMDDLEPRKTVKLKCGHRMCKPCLKRSFKLSVTDSQHMPPKCCTKDQIPLKHVERLFSNDFKKTWNKKYREHARRNRVYCPRKFCNEFIRSEELRQLDDGRRYWKCAKCNTKVCFQCNAKHHRGKDCVNDEETAKFVAQAKEEGWQRCHSCRAVVELKEGCNHMTCRCGAQFCMVCGKKWRTCECAWFNYDTSESDRLQHIHVPREPFVGREAAEVPLSPHRIVRPGLGSGPRPQHRSFEEEMRRRRLQEQSDAELARRLQASHAFGDEHEDDYLGGFGEVHGIGNAAGHFMNEDYRPRPRNFVVPQPPPPHAPTIPSLEPSALGRAPPGDYIQGVNRMRGVRATSLNRLAERFNKDGRQSAAHRPPALPTSQTMPLPVMTPATGLAYGSTTSVLPMRRHTGGGTYIEELPSRSGVTRCVERVTASGRTKRPVVYDEPEEMTLSKGSGVREEPEAPTSAMAGLTDGLKGRFRVHEWRDHVPFGNSPDHP